MENLFLQRQILHRSLNGDVCLTHYLWEDLSRQIHTFLSGISLASLVQRAEVRAVSRRQDAKEKERGSQRNTIQLSQV